MHCVLTTTTSSVGHYFGTDPVVALGHVGHAGVVVALALKGGGAVGLAAGARTGSAPSAADRIGVPRPSGMAWLSGWLQYVIDEASRHAPMVPCARPHHKIVTRAAALVIAYCRNRSSLERAAPWDAAARRAQARGFRVVASARDPSCSPARAHVRAARARVAFVVRVASKGAVGAIPRVGHVHLAIHRGSGIVVGIVLAVNRKRSQARRQLLARVVVAVKRVVAFRLRAPTAGSRLPTARVASAQTRRRWSIACAQRGSSSYKSLCATNGGQSSLGFQRQH